jgi:hypothetical protein
MVEWREKNRHQHFDSICLYYSHRHFNGEKKIRKFFFIIIKKANTMALVATMM